MYLLFLITLLSLQKVQGSIEESMMDLPDISTANWTTCEEFLNGTRFEVDSVIDVDWVIFYYWTTHAETSYHIRFSAPTPMVSFFLFVLTFSLTYFVVTTFLTYPLVSLCLLTASVAQLVVDRTLRLSSRVRYRD